jgi:hypothetical protein
MKLYSLLLAWDINDVAEQGCYGTCVQAENYSNAVHLARVEMDIEYREDVPEDEIVEAPTDYVVIDCHEGANIWAAPQMLEALRTIAERASDPAADENEDAIQVTLDCITQMARAAIRVGSGEDGPPEGSENLA